MSTLTGVNPYAQSQLFCEFLALQHAEVESPFNRLCAAQALGINPDFVSGNQLYTHYMSSGRHIVFRYVHNPENIYGTGQEIGIDPITLPWDAREIALWQHFCQWNPEVPPFDMDLFPFAEKLRWIMSGPF